MLLLGGFLHGVFSQDYQRAHLRPPIFKNNFHSYGYSVRLDEYLYALELNNLIQIIFHIVHKFTNEELN